MSYNKDLGRVKGDTGTTYIPQIKLKNDGKQYISYTSNDGTPIPNELQEKEFISYVYTPSLDEDGNLSFTLTNNLVASINVGNIKGPIGNSTIGIKIVPQKPNFNDLSDDEKELIEQGKNALYIIDSNEAYADVGVFKTNGEFVYLENKIRFDNYYTKAETYNKTEVYNKNEIATQLGSITEQQNAIIQMLGDTDAIIITDDD